MMQYIRSKPEEDHAGIVGKRNVLGPAQWKRGLAKSGIEFDKKGRFVGSPRRVPEELIQPKEAKIIPDVLPEVSAAADKKDLQNEEKSRILLKDAKTLEDLADYARNEWGVSDIDIGGLNVGAIKETFAVMESAVENYPQLKGAVREIGQKTNATMGTTPIQGGGFRLDINPNYFGDGGIEGYKDMYANAMGYGYFTHRSDWSHTGVHELGHVAHGLLAQDGASNFEAFAKDWNNHKTPTKIVSEAWKAVKAEYPKDTYKGDAIAKISTYAKRSDSETIAEAFVNVFVKKDAAEPLSREIVKIMMERL
jgi:hypothetical protein